MLTNELELEMVVGEIIVSNLISYNIISSSDEYIMIDFKLHQTNTHLLFGTLVYPFKLPSDELKHGECILDLSGLELNTNYEVQILEKIMPFENVIAVFKKLTSSSVR